MGLNLRQMSFPSKNFTEGQTIQIRRCTSFVEAASMIANESFGVTNFFICFYNGFAEESIIWFAYRDDNHDFENPVKFQLDDWRDDEYATNSLREILAPRILPANLTLRRGQPCFEFYYPSAVARQLGFGQVPIHLFFADKVPARDAIKSPLAYNRLKNLEPDASTIYLGNWQITPFSTIPFLRW